MQYAKKLEMLMLKPIEYDRHHKLAFCSTFISVTL